MEHRFGGPVTMFDPATRTKLTARVFGTYQCECDEDTARARVSRVILAAFKALADASPTPVQLVSDPAAFPTKIEPAIRDALAAQGLPPARIGDWNASLSPDSIDALKAANEKRKAPAAIAAGAPVLVQWSDGNRYPGTVRSVAEGQYEIAFPDGQVRWIPAAYVART